MSKYILSIHHPRHLIVLVTAGLLALVIFSAPMAFDQIAGTSLTTAANACQSASGGC